MDRAGAVKEQHGWRHFCLHDGEATLTELASYAEAMGKSALPGSGRQEYLESIVNSLLFG